MVSQINNSKEFSLSGVVAGHFTVHSSPAVQLQETSQTCDFFQTDFGVVALLGSADQQLQAWVGLSASKCVLPAPKPAP